MADLDNIRTEHARVGAFIGAPEEALSVDGLLVVLDRAHADRGALLAVVDDLTAEVARLQAILNAPELYQFTQAVSLEAAHQRARWGSDHDAGKAPEDWFWLLGYLGGKALHAAKSCDRDKALHHCISSAAVLANWHSALLGRDTSMRPGIQPPNEETAR